MAKYELPIYGNNDEIVKTHATNIVPWAVFIQAADLEESIKNKSAKEQNGSCRRNFKSCFP